MGPKHTHRRRRAREHGTTNENTSARPALKATKQRRRMPLRGYGRWFRRNGKLSSSRAFAVGGVVISHARRYVTGTITHTSPLPPLAASGTAARSPARPHARTRPNTSSLGFLSTQILRVRSRGHPALSPARQRRLPAPHRRLLLPCPAPPRSPPDPPDPPPQLRRCVSKEVPPAGYVPYFLNAEGNWRPRVPCNSLNEQELSTSGTL